MKGVVPVQRGRVAVLKVTPPALCPISSALDSRGNTGVNRNHLATYLFKLRLVGVSRTSP